MSGLLITLTVIAGLGCAVVCGVFVAFSTLVMKSLATVPAPQGISTMQAINRAAPAPVFMGLFLGTAAACLAVAVWSLFFWANASTAWLLAGGLVYLAGSFGLTVGYHVPRNNALASADPDGAEPARQWARYLREWTRWNHVRGCASLAAAILFTMALVLG